MRLSIVALILLSFFIDAMPAEARRRGYYDENGNWVSTRRAYRARAVDADGHSYREYRRNVRQHRRRRNVLLGVGALGLITGSGLATGVGLGGAAANHFIDDEHRDY